MPRHRVLLVDDDAVIIELLAALLEDAGFEVRTAGSAMEARAVLTEYSPALILLDVVLPDADGREFCHWLKAEQRTKDTFVILISGLAVGPSSCISGLNLGADDYLTKPVQPQELIARIRSFLRIRQAADELRHAKEHLEVNVQARTAELREANLQLQRSTEDLRTLSRRLLETQERERRRLAHELHDEAGQTLTVLNYSFDTLEAAGNADPRALNDGRGALKRLTTLIRNLWQELRPALLDDLGIVPALLWYFERYMPATGVRVEFHADDVDRQRFNPEIETAVYRTVQESLTNVARHAGVSSAMVSLRTTATVLLVEVLDHGKGFNPRAGLSRDGSCGLVGMSERVRLLGGSFAISSDPGKGTRVMAEFPLLRAHEEVTLRPLTAPLESLGLAPGLSAGSFESATK